MFYQHFKNIFDIIVRVIKRDHFSFVSLFIACLIHSSRDICNFPRQCNEILACNGSVMSISDAVYSHLHDVTL